LRPFRFGVIAAVEGAQGQAADPGVADDPAGGGQPEGLALAVEMRIQATAFELDHARQRIDP
jgi:hypothetical protein